MKKSQKGFTLVELIVVIAIIGVLAAILVPAMMGYIKDSKKTSAEASAKNVYTALNAYCQKCFNAGYGIPDGDTDVVSIAAGDGEAEVTSSAADIADIDAATPFLTDAVNNNLGADAAGSVWKARFDNNFPTQVYWAKTASDEYVGGYPTAVADADIGEKNITEVNFPSAPAGGSTST